MKKYWRAEAGLFLGVWLALMVLGRTQLFRDPGTFWHTVMGRRMLSSRHLVYADPFSFTFAGRPWVPFEWLAECVMAVIHAVGGFDGLLLATATTLAGLYDWLGHRLIRGGLHWLPTTLLVAFTIAVGASHFHARPHIGSMVFFAITCSLLCDFESGRIGLGRLSLIVVPLFVVWTNWHGAMLGGLATLGLAVSGWDLARMIGRDSPIANARQSIPLWLLVIACGLTMLVNPYGIRLPATWLEIMGSPVVPRLIIEHAPPSPRKPEFWIIVALGLGYAMVFLSTLPRWPRVTWLIPFVWFALSLSRVRHSALFGIAAMIALAEMLPHSRLATWLARPGRDLFRPGVEVPAPGRRRLPYRDWRPAILLPVVLVSCCVALQAGQVRVPILGRGWAGLDPTIWPVELLPELRRIDREHPQGARIFNDHVFGGFLIYHTPNLKVFIDDRCELYGDAWLDRFDRAGTIEPGLMEEWLEQYRIDYVLVETGAVFDRYISEQPGWSPLGRSRAATLYGRVPAETHNDGRTKIAESASARSTGASGRDKLGVKERACPPRFGSKSSGLSETSWDRSEMSRPAESGFIPRRERPPRRT